MSQIVAICNQKGGVGKTALTINLGAALAEQGKKVLLIDLDPQGHLTEGIGMKDLYLQIENNLFQALVEAKVEKGKLIHKVPHEKFDFVPSNIDMALAEQKLYMTRSREHKLKALLEDLRNGYDWILIDCPPNLGNLTDNALIAARLVIVPVQAETTSVRALELLFDQIDSIERELKIHVDILAIVPNLVQDSALARRILNDFRSASNVVTPIEIKKRVVLQEAYDKGHSIFSFQAPSTSKSDDTNELRRLYTELADFITKQVEKRKI